MPPNTGRTVAGVKQGSTMTVQDAFRGVERSSNEFQLGAGLFWCRSRATRSRARLRSCRSTTATYTFLFTARPAQNVVGRDTGFHARGYLLGNHLEYRTGVFQGQARRREPPGAPLHGSGHVQRLRHRDGLFLRGDQLREEEDRRVRQRRTTPRRTTTAFAADAFVDWPVPGGKRHHVPGRLQSTTTAATPTARCPRQNTFHAEAGFYGRGREGHAPTGSSSGRT